MTEGMLKLYNIFDKIKWVGMLISGLAMFVMLFYTCADVFLRYFFNLSFLYTYEFSRSYFMPLAVFPGLAYAFSRGVMPRIDLLIMRVRTTYQWAVAILLIIIEIILFLLLTIYGAKYTYTAIIETVSFTAGGENYVLWPVIILAPISFLLVLIECIFLLIKNLRSKTPSFVVLDK